MKKISKKTAIICTAGAVVILFAAAIFIIGGGKSKTETITIEPGVTQIMNGAIDERVTASGTVQVADEYSIFIELSQEVKEIFAEVGDEVKEGDLLITYEIEDTKRDLETKLESAQISYENAKMTFDELASPAEGTELIDLKTTVISAQNKLDSAQKSYDELEKNLPYYRQMLSIGSISQQEYTDYEAQLVTLANELESAKMALEKAQINLQSGENILSTKEGQNSYKKQLNSVKTAQTSLETAQLNLDKLTEATYSPINGTIIESVAVEGQMLTDSTAIMKIADLTNLDVMTYVSEYDIAKVKVGQRVELTTDGIEDTVFNGTVIKIEPVAQSQGTISGSETVVPVLVHLDDVDERIKPGFSFDMEIIVTDLSGTDFIPVSAVMMDTENDSYYVYVVGNDEKQTLEKRTVEIGITSDMYIQIVSGLEKDEKIMESPTSDVKEGTGLMDYTETREISADMAEAAENGSLMGGMPMGGGMPSGGGMPMGGGMPSGGGMPMGGGPGR